VEIPADYQLGALTLPAPGGGPIGTASFVAGTPDRPLYVIAWYPAARRGAAPATYLAPAGQRVQVAGLRRNFGWPAGMLDRIAAAPRGLGADSRSVLREAGLHDDAIDALVRAGFVGISGERPLRP